jgi:hypothetical protein
LPCVLWAQLAHRTVELACSLLAIEALPALLAELVAPANDPPPTIHLHAHCERSTPTKVCRGVCIVLA